MLLHITSRLPVLELNLVGRPCWVAAPPFHRAAPYSRRKTRRRDPVRQSRGLAARRLRPLPPHPLRQCQLNRSTGASEGALIARQVRRPPDKLMSSAIRRCTKKLEDRIAARWYSKDLARHSGYSIPVTSASLFLARASRLITVPIGISNVSAASR